MIELGEILMLALLAKRCVGTKPQAIQNCLEGRECFHGFKKLSDTARLNNTFLPFKTDAQRTRGWDGSRGEMIESFVYGSIFHYSQKNPRRIILTRSAGAPSTSKLKAKQNWSMCAPCI